MFFRNEAWHIKWANSRLQYTISDSSLNCIVAEWITAESSSHSCFWIMFYIRTVHEFTEHNIWVVSSSASYLQDLWFKAQPKTSCHNWDSFVVSISYSRNGICSTVLQEVMICCSFKSSMYQHHATGITCILYREFFERLKQVSLALIIHAVSCVTLQCLCYCLSFMAFTAQFSLFFCSHQVIQKCLLCSCLYKKGRDGEIYTWAMNFSVWEFTATE